MGYELFNSSMMMFSVAGKFLSVSCRKDGGDGEESRVFVGSSHGRGEREARK